MNVEHCNTNANVTINEVLVKLVKSLKLADHCDSVLFDFKSSTDLILELWMNIIGLVQVHAALVQWSLFLVCDWYCLRAWMILANAVDHISRWDRQSTRR